MLVGLLVGIQFKIKVIPVLEWRQTITAKLAMFRFIMDSATCSLRGLVYNSTRIHRGLQCKEIQRYKCRKCWDNIIFFQQCVPMNE